MDQFHTEILQLLDAIWENKTKFEKRNSQLFKD